MSTLAVLRDMILSGFELLFVLFASWAILEAGRAMRSEHERRLAAMRRHPSSRALPRRWE